MAQTANFEELQNFLSYLSNKGLMKEQTVVSRKAAVNKVFDALDEEDRLNVLAVDLDDVMNRFVNKMGSNYSPGTLQNYKSRLRATLEDFASYQSDPMSFKPSIQQRASRKPKPSPGIITPNSEAGTVSNSTSTNPQLIEVPPPSANILPIPVRSDLVIKIQGLPFDLTEAEAAKISAVIKAFVSHE